MVFEGAPVRVAAADAAFLGDIAVGEVVGLGVGVAWPEQAAIALAWCRFMVDQGLTLDESDRLRLERLAVAISDASVQVPTIDEGDGRQAAAWGRAALVAAAKR